MNISKHKTCFGSIKYSQVLESLSLRGGVRRKAYAPYRNYVIPLRDCISQISFNPPTSSQLPNHDLVSYYSEDTKAMKLSPAPPVTTKFQVPSGQCSVVPFQENAHQKNYQWAVLLDAGIYSLLCCQETLSFEMSYFDIFITSFPLLPQLRFLSLYVAGAHASHLKN